MLVAVLVAALVVDASAAGWHPPALIPPTERAIDDVRIGVDAQGNAVAIWTQASIFWRRTQAVTRPVGGRWSERHTFEVPNERSGWNPSLAVGPAGDAAVIWLSTTLPDAERQFTVVATRDAGDSRWSQPQILSLNGEDDLGITVDPTIVVDAQGTATAMWVESTGGEGRMIRTSTRPRGGEWSEPQELTPRSTGRSAETPQLAVNSHGDVIAAWVWHEPWTAGMIQAAIRPAGGEWSDPIDLTEPDVEMLEPRVAINDLGQAVVIWSGNAPLTEGGPGIQAIRRSADGTWGPVADVSGPDCCTNGDVALDEDGNATVAWEWRESRTTAGRIIQASTSGPDGRWTEPVDISIRDEATGWGANVRLAIDGQGNVTAAWRNWQAGFSQITTVARLEPGGRWSDPVDIGDGFFESVAADPHGYVTAAWTNTSSLGPDEVLTSTYDDTSPEIQSLTVPTDALVGEPVEMSLVASDIWSAITARWDLGDTTTATGTNITHCYATPGQHTIITTVTDAVGNTTTDQRTIDIAPNPDHPDNTQPCGGTDPNPDPDPDPDPGSDPDPDPTDRPDPSNRPPTQDPQTDQPKPPTGTQPKAPTPRITGLRTTNKRWRTHNTRRRPRLPTGTTLVFHLTHATRLRLTITQLTPGRRTNRRCTKPTRTNRNKPRCTRQIRRATTTITAKKGLNRHKLRGRINNRTLPPGHYRLTLATTNTKPTTATTTFTIAP